MGMGLTDNMKQPAAPVHDRTPTPVSASDLQAQKMDSNQMNRQKMMMIAQLLQSSAPQAAMHPMPQQQPDSQSAYQQYLNQFNAR